MDIIYGLIAGHQTGHIDLEKIISTAAAKHEQRRIRREELMSKKNKRPLMPALIKGGLSPTEASRIVSRFVVSNEDGPVDLDNEHMPLSHRVAHHKAVKDTTRDD